MKNLVFSRRAEKELEDIVSYFEQVNPTAGKRALARIAEALETLSKFPGSGTRTRKGNVRSLYVTGTNYRVFFVTSGDIIEVASIFDTRRSPAHAPKG